LKKSPSYRYGKTDKLKSRKQIEQLFREGKTISEPPLRLIWLRENHLGQLQAGVSVSRRHYKRAVDRNLIKRRMREAYRLNKNELSLFSSEQQILLSLFWIYTSRKILPFSEMEKACRSILQKLIKQLS
jgi:ribonuclease P protein component